MILSDYQDSDSYWHDEKCENGKPRSNNRNIYTAYSKYLAPNTMHYDMVARANQRCIKSLYPLKINRLPNIETPVLSKDEIIGMVSLKLLHPEKLRDSYYNHCNLDVDFPRKLTIKTTIIAIWELYKIYKETKTLTGSNKRNYAWENNRVNSYPLLFKLPPWDIYYCKVMENVKPSIIESMLFEENAKHVIEMGDKSSRMLLWVQLQDMKHPLLEEVPLKKWVDTYFEEGHPFRDETKWNV